MSAFMVNNTTRTIIARYLAAAANGDFETYPLYLSPDAGFCEVLKKEGCYDEGTGLFSAAAIHEVLTKYNHLALEYRYGTEGAKEMHPQTGEKMESGIRLDKSEGNARHWLPNLYTVCRCLSYQVCEGEIPETEFYEGFERWTDTLSHALANMLVVEERGPLGKSRPWDRF